MSKSIIRIGLADDEELFRKGIAFILEREPDLEVVFEAQDGQKLLDKLEQADPLPDVVLTDLKMPMLNGIEATREVVKKYPSVKVIALTSYNTRAFIANMVDIGASAFFFSSIRTFASSIVTSKGSAPFGREINFFPKRT